MNDAMTGRQRAHTRRLRCPGLATTRELPRVACLALLATLALATAPAAAQQVSVRSPSPAWLGIGYEVLWVQRGEDCQPRVMVESVIQGAPADRAGVRVGDAIVTVRGRPASPGLLELIAAPLTPGDSVRMTLSRQGAVREVVAVADRRPDRPTASATRSGTAPVAPGAALAPMIRVSRDSIVAWNLEAVSGRPRPAVRGYWLTRGGNRVEYRRLDHPVSRSEVDRRVASLLECALSARWTARPAAAGDVQRIQLRADSLRVLIAQRAMAPAALERRTNLDREALELRMAVAGALERPPAPDWPTPEAPAPNRPFAVQPAEPAQLVFRLRELEHHLTAAGSGVAGAELTALEPELAAYFRGASRGLLVLRVADGSPAQRAGLRPGDVITGGGGREFESVPALLRLLALPDPTPVELRVVRQGRARSLTIPRD